MQDYGQALKWYRVAADSGDVNARENHRRLQARLLRDQYAQIVSEFSDLVADHAPLIGDCSVLPHPKRRILYAITWTMDYWEDSRE